MSMHIDRAFRRTFLLLCLLSFPNVTLLTRAQALRGTTGLLHAPTAEMQRSGTFIVGTNVLALEPLHFLYTDEITHTFNYYFNLTLFSRLEVSYVCTLNYAVQGSNYFPESVWGTYSNQDRSFYARLLLVQEGQWADWVPSVVLGADDPMSHTMNGAGAITVTDALMADNHFTRYYLALTKHFTFRGIGKLGAHLSWCDIYGTGSQTVGHEVEFEHIQRPAFGVNLRLSDLDERLKALRGLNLMAEYDARTINIGFQYSLWRDKFNVVFELNDFKYVSAGIYYRTNIL